MSPIVIFSRETNSSLQNDFNPNVPDMDLSTEGEITLPWNDFIDYTMFEIESQLQALNVQWALGESSPFPAMRAGGGAIGGLEFGVEPQTNNASDEPYSLLINKYVVAVNGIEHGLIDFGTLSNDTQSPTASIAAPVSYTHLTLPTTPYV